MISKEIISDWFKELQDTICRSLEHVDGTGRFQTDNWDRPGGGGGITRIITSGNIIEKGGVNFSAVWGKAPKTILHFLGLPEDTDTDFFASGVSIVIHPFNPAIPIIHMNVRYFELSTGAWWFGGGMDLTPHYVSVDDAKYFHQQLKDVCDRHHPSYYDKFKKWADDYFFIKHRNETRGIGGVFFDYLKDDEGFTKASRFAFIKDIGSAFAPIYAELINRNSPTVYASREKKWQLLRRGRYVEFNLVWDRGTKFGLDTDGRTESILMSLPPQAEWVYQYDPEPGSKEAKTLSLLRKEIDWINA